MLIGIEKVDTDVLNEFMEENILSKLINDSFNNQLSSFIYFRTKPTIL